MRLTLSNFANLAKVFVWQNWQDWVTLARLAESPNGPFVSSKSQLMNCDAELILGPINGSLLIPHGGCRLHYVPPINLAIFLIHEITQPGSHFLRPTYFTLRPFSLL